MEPANTCQEMAPSSPSFSASSSRNLFSCCFDWVSVFHSWCSMESNSMASASTSGRIPDNEGMGAFHEIAPYASTSGTSSTLIQKPSFDVFINHRGPDVKKTLASRIYEILDDMKVTAFLDSEELEYGDFLPSTIEAAIRCATLHIAIFSKRYAESAWCLEELSLMIKSGAKIIPIFYHVEPTDLRFVAQGKGKYVAAFKKHESKCRYKPEKLREWKEALSKSSLYIGEIIKNNGDEMRVLKNIVNIVLKETSNVPLVVAKHPVGLNEAVGDFENTLQLAQGDQGVQIVGIWGMGGSGKTTLAKELYNKRSSSMERCCFIFDIREAKGVLQKKQIELLKGLGVVNAEVDNIEQGKAILARHLRSFRVLIVMDDVDHADQLDALLPVKDNLGRGSLIIVTTRESEVLTCWGIHSIYKMKPLDPLNAEQLFCWHAFLHSSPLHGFEVLVKKFIKACDGLPLSLKVFGGQLYGKYSKQYWEALFGKISRILPSDIKKKLKISYDALDNEEKDAFLDTACFFIGEESSLAIEIWDGSGWSGLYTCERLLNKCLIEIDSNNRIRMHDHLRDLGREIANQHSPSRLWLPQQIIDSAKQIEKINGIRGIQADLRIIEGRLSYQEEQSSERMLSLTTSLVGLTTSLVGLKLLVTDGDYFNQVIAEASRELVWLRWSYTRQRNFPAWLSLKNLRVLGLFGGHDLEELWEAESDAPVQLRELNLSDCFNLRRVPNSIGCLNQLKKIVIKRSGIDSLPEEFCRLQLLEYLVLSMCGMLSSLPSSFGDLTNLRYVDLWECRRLRRLPVSFKNLMLLQHLNLEGCNELILRLDDFQNITKLEHLDLSGCMQLEELPTHITNQASLRKLNLRGLKRLREVPNKICQLSRLRKMWIESELLISLPNSLGDLSSLTTLAIQACSNLESLPASLGTLCSLTYLNICECPKLKHSYIWECPISRVDFGAASVSLALSNLKYMTLEGTEICRISLSKDCYPRLKSLSLKNNNHLTKIEALPVNLEDLSICGSPKVDELPSFSRLTSLRKFLIRDCDRIEKIEGLKYCTGLEELSLHTCWEVPGIESLEHMEKLRRLELKANKGSGIGSCIQTIQKWPEEIIICTRAVPDVSSMVDSFQLGLSPNLSVVDSFSNQDILSKPKSLQNHSSNGNAIMLCFTINLVCSPKYIFGLTCEGGYFYGSSPEIGEGRWAFIFVFTQRSRWQAANGAFHIFPVNGEKRNKEVERGLLVRGEEQRLVEELLPLLQSISR